MKHILMPCSITLSGECRFNGNAMATLENLDDYKAASFLNAQCGLMSAIDYRSNTFVTKYLTGDIYDQADRFSSEIRNR